MYREEPVAYLLSVISREAAIGTDKLNRSWLEGTAMSGFAYLATNTISKDFLHRHVTDT